MESMGYGEKEVIWWHLHFEEIKRGSHTFTLTKPKPLWFWSDKSIQPCK